MHTLFLASPDALEVMFVSIDFTDVTLVSEDTCGNDEDDKGEEGEEGEEGNEMMKMIKVI